MSHDRDDDHSTAAHYARLLSLAAHEFRTPASVVGGYLRMLQNDAEPALNERHRKLVDEAAKSCAKMAQLATELSEIGRLDSDAVSVHLETFDLFAQLEEVARNVHAGDDREVALQLSGSATGAVITGDRQRLTAAFHAFFRALLREQPAGVQLAVDRRIVQRGVQRSAVVVVAKDTAVQRAYDAPDQPFDEYRGGVGLSLPIARRIVERAGGRIWSPRPDDDADRSLRSALVVSLPLPE